MAQSLSLRILDRYVVPAWADRNVEDIKKSDISELLASIAQGRSKGSDGKLLGTPAIAGATRAQLVTLFNWYVEHYGSDIFRSPIVKSKNTAQWKPAARERVLEDHEIRALWKASDGLGAYGAAVKCALLTAQRFHKVGVMRRADLKASMRIQGRMADDGQWVPDQDIGMMESYSTRGAAPTTSTNSASTHTSPSPLGVNSIGSYFGLRGLSVMRVCCHSFLVFNSSLS
jgi:hypothetical protein